jgi:HPr kinase/phosphorylase
MPITVREFFEAGRSHLQMEIECGEEYLDTLIEEDALNRPGLALAGFFKYFAKKRLQVFGLVEGTYLNSLQDRERRQRLRQMFRQRVPGIVVTRHRHVLPEIRELTQEFKIPVLRSSMITGRFMNQATLLIDSLVSPRARVHGTMVDILGVGVMLEGEPGIGKSETALTLIERGHSLVADDITVLRRRGSEVLASAVEITRYHMEIRGLGIIHVPSLFGVASMRGETRLDLIVRLDRQSPQNEVDRSGLASRFRDVLGIQIPFVALPVAAGRDLAHVVEVAALNQRLKQLGHDAAKELNEKLIGRMAQKRVGG